MNSENKRQYDSFCEKAYVPIYSKPWWMDAVCGPDNWDVWLYEQGGESVAAMPYYLEEREHGLYITKAPLTQNNGMIFLHPKGAGYVARAKFEEKAVRAAMSFVDSLGLAVYEQQYQTSFTNWLPFSWCGCEAIPRYTYAIGADVSKERAWNRLSSKQRSVVRKGVKAISSIEDLNPADFYELHRGVFERQGLKCPFSSEMWERLYGACSNEGCCRALAARDLEGRVASLIFLVWDDRRMYHLLGGGMPGSRSLDTYGALVWKAIELSREMGLTYDFEGSMIERISKSFREFGGEPELYFRIRKVYSPEVVRMEAERKMEKLKEEL